MGNPAAGKKSWEQYARELEVKVARLEGQIDLLKELIKVKEPKPYDKTKPCSSWPGVFMCICNHPDCVNWKAHR